MVEKTSRHLDNRKHILYRIDLYLRPVRPVWPVRCFVTPFHINSSNITGHHRTLTMSEIQKTPRDPNDPVYQVNRCLTQIFKWPTKNTLFVTIFPWGCTEFPEFSMFREIPEYSRFSRFVATLDEEVESRANNVKLPVWVTATLIWRHKETKQTIKISLTFVIVVYLHHRTLNI